MTKGMAAMLVYTTKECSYNSIVIVHQHGGYDVTCEPRILWLRKFYIIIIMVVVVVVVVAVINWNTYFNRRRETSVNSPHKNGSGRFTLNTVRGGHHPLWGHQGTTAVANPRARSQLSLPRPVSTLGDRAPDNPCVCGANSTRVWCRQSAVSRCLHNTSNWYQWKDVIQLNVYISIV